MVQSINTKVDLTMAGTSYMGLSDYGKIMIGDKGFECGSIQVEKTHFT